MSKNFADIYLYEIAFNLIPQQLFLNKSNKHQEVKGKNMILKCLCPHVGCIAP